MSAGVVGGVILCAVAVLTVPSAHPKTRAMRSIRVPAALFPCWWYLQFIFFFFSPFLFFYFSVSGPLIWCWGCHLAEERLLSPAD